MTTKFNSSSDSSFNKEPENFKEPKLDTPIKFSRYCAIYDPTVIESTACEVQVNINYKEDEDEEFKFFVERQGKWQAKAAVFIGIVTGGISNINYYYSCISPYRSIDAEYIKEFLKAYQQSPNDYQDERALKFLLKDLLLKQYIMYELKNGEIGWIILLRCKHTRLEETGDLDPYLWEPSEPSCDVNYTVYGEGKELPEADLKFCESRIAQFKKNQNTIAEVINLDIPLNPYRMFSICKKLDQSVKINTLKFNFIEENGNFGEGSQFKAECRSETRKFFLEYDSKVPDWWVIKYIPVDSYPLCDIYVEAEGQGQTLEQAFEQSELYYQELLSNSELMQIEIHRAINIEQAEEMMSIARDSEEHMNWLLSEIGEDAFPDRD